MGAIKYIQNVHDSSIVCKITSDKNRRFEFSPKRVDKKQNLLLHTGFTGVSEEDLALLEKESHVFKFFSSKGQLIVTDSVPKEALSPDQLIIVLQSENDELKRKIAALSAELKTANDAVAALSSGASAGVEEFEKKIVEQETQLEEKDKQIAELTEQVEILTAQVEEALITDKEDPGPDESPDGQA